MNYSEINRVREQKKIKIVDLCNKIGISKTAYYSTIKSKSSPSVKLLEAISKVLGVDTSYWWQKDIEKENILNDNPIEYTTNCSNCKRLIKQIEQQQDHINLLMEECNRKKNTSVG